MIQATRQYPLDITSMSITSLPKPILFSLINLDKADNSNIYVTNEKYNIKLHKIYSNSNRCKIFQIQLHIIYSYSNESEIFQK